MSNNNDAAQNWESDFNKQSCGIPFGKYNAASDDESPCNASMVGREGARAKLISFLNNTGRHGSILITGRRGAGKTSFVNYCIKEYEDSVIQRYMASDIGRTLWSQLWLGVKIFLLANAILLGSIMEEVFVSAVDHNQVLWLPLIIIAAMLFYPMIYAYNIINLVVDGYIRNRRDAKLWAGLVIVLFMFLIFDPFTLVNGDFGSPAVSMSKMALAVSVYCFLWAFFGLIGGLLSKPDKCRSFVGKKTMWRRVIRDILILAIVCCAVYLSSNKDWYILSYTFTGAGEGKYIIPGTSRYMNNLLLTIISLFFILVTKYVYKSNSGQSKWLYGLVMLMVFVLAVATTSVLGVNFSYKEINRPDNWPYILVSVAVIFAILALICHKFGIKVPSTSSPSALLLVLKALFFVIVSMQALHPVVYKALTESYREGFVPEVMSCNWDINKENIEYKIQGDFTDWPFNGAIGFFLHGLSNENFYKIDEYLLYKHGVDVNNNAHKQRLLLTATRPLCNFVANGSKYKAANGIKDSQFSSAKKSEPQYLPLFQKWKSQLSWFIAILIVITILYVAEYEWIIMPGMNKHQDTALSPPGIDEKNVVVQEKARFEKSVIDIVKERIRYTNYLRELEQYTFFWLICKLRVQSITCSVNLGFKEINHRSVIHSMLLRLREEYHKKFVAWSSPYAVMKVVLTFMLSMIMVTELSEFFFENLEDYHISPQIYAATKLNLGQADELKNYVFYCNPLQYGKKPGLKDRKATDRLLTGLPRVPGILCAMNMHMAETVIPLLYAMIVEIPISDTIQHEDKSVSWFFHMHKPYYYKNYDLGQIINYEAKGDGVINDGLGGSTKQHAAENNQKGIKLDLKSLPEQHKTEASLLVYHVLLFFVVLSGFRFTARLFPFTSHALMLAKIDDLLDGLTANTTFDRKKPFWAPARWLNTLYGNYSEEGAHIERKMLDSRAVELAFLGILQDIQSVRSFLEMPHYKNRDTPSLEIVFIFDEVDKLAHNIEAQDKTGGIDSNYSEQYRLSLMKALLSDMKRIITSAPARFIFIGGRLLHDEWLADGAKRQPLLTSVFDDEIYIHSLLSDASATWHYPKPIVQPHWHNHIEAFFCWQYYLSCIRLEKHQANDDASVFLLHGNTPSPRSFMPVDYFSFKHEKFPDNSRFAPIQYINIINTLTGEYLNKIWDNNTPNSPDTDASPSPYSSWEQTRLKLFIEFLAYRSAGNPKRLKELLSSFIITKERALRTLDVRKDFNDQHVLCLPDQKVLRVQFVARVYQHLYQRFSTRLTDRNNKTIVSLIKLTDFLFKFHGRAFSWDSLELMDELMHIHRAHDLRQLLHDLVEHYAQRYLCRIINGMYMYRFRTDFAKEIEYLSRISEEEMAAFNFTLDEAEDLRANYQAILAENNNKDNPDVISLLGELHENNQEYEAARQYYRQSMWIWDKEFATAIGKTVKLDGDDVAILQAVYADGKPEGAAYMRFFIYWGPIKVRALLKIAMTYELVSNYDEALLRYRQAMKLAYALMETLYSDNAVLTSDYGYFNPYRKDTSPYIHILEHLDILYQPLFAYAWLVEKQAHSVEISTQVVEEGLQQMFKRIPMLGETGGDNSSLAPRQAFAFIAAQLHKKAGALYFYKGLKPCYYKPSDTSGLARAYYWYAKSNAELARYISVSFIGRAQQFDAIDQALSHFPWPHNISQSVAESLNDLAESIYAQIDVDGLFASKLDLPSVAEFGDNAALDLIVNLDKWYDNNGSVTASSPAIHGLLNPDHKLKAADALQHLDSAFSLSIASWMYLCRAGHFEVAGSESICTVDAISRYIWWYVIQHGPLADESASDLPYYIFAFASKAVFCIERQTQLFHSARDKAVNAENKRCYLQSGVIPVPALTAACSLGLALCCCKSLFPVKAYRFNWLLRQLSSAIFEWNVYGFAHLHLDYDSDFWRNIIINSLRRNRYPVLNQLVSLKLLADSVLLANDAASKYTMQHVNRWISELHEINQQYDEPLLFTPAQIGVTLYLYSKHRDQIPIDTFDLVTTARTYLNKSTEMCCSGKAYYSRLQKMHYLYDDFNDSRVHLSHALQMSTQGMLEKLSSLL